MISYEFEGRAASGGIGTYVRNAAALLAGRGHDVEVFTTGETASDGADGTLPFLVHGIEGTRETFTRRIAQVFAERHLARPFDVIEGPEYGADAVHVAAMFPALPLVVKLHTPGSVIGDINNLYVDWTTKLRFVGSGLRRGRLTRPFWWKAENPDDRERDHTRSADVIVGPSRAILDRLKTEWALPEDRLAFVPCVFTPPPALMMAPPDTQTSRVTFLGRLEVRKGVLELATAIPLVCAEAPESKFRIIGRSLPMPGRALPVREAMRRRLGRWQTAVEFIDAVPYSKIPDLLSDSDICVFPSVWESFGMVCLEAMAAARGVVASSGGGMAEIVEHGRTGLLVPPRDPKAIANAILQMLRDPARRIAMGRAARAHVAGAYGPDVIGPMQEESYRRAIENAARRQAKAA